MTDIIVVGLDGANWDLLAPWLDDGQLPNIESLRDEGETADMQSCLPPVTCPNWRCYSTGKNPGKLGVYWWERIDTESRNLSTPNSRSFESANYWNYLNEEGQTAGIVNLPMTYPPLEVDGFLVAGGPGSEQEDYTYPPELSQRLDESGYILHPERPVTSKLDDDAAAAVSGLIDQRLSTFRELLRTENPDVAHCTVFYVNVLQHFFYRGAPTFDAWQVIDEHVGALREEQPDATLVLMSDHGCAPIDTVFYANSWLESQGYLHTTGGARHAAAKAGLNKERLSHLAHAAGIHGLVTRLAPEWLTERLPKSSEGDKREAKLEHVDWERSRAIASGQGLVYAIDDDVVPELVADLEAVSDEHGPVAAEVLTREEEWEGPHLDVAPEIVFDQRVGVHTSGAIGDNPVFSGTGKWEAENVRTGLFLAAGPDVEGSLDGDISITDIAPTLLHAAGCSVPTDMDGTVLPLFGGEPTFREPIPYAEVTGEASSDVQDRLADLGYLE